VAFVWNGEKQDNFDIYVKLMGTAGPPLRLTNDPARDDSPAIRRKGGLSLKARISIVQISKKDNVPAVGRPGKGLGVVGSSAGRSTAIHR
jgi:hypothetical protein